MLANLAYQERVDSRGNPVGLKPIIGPATQYLVEHGRSAPYMWSRERCQQYWSTKTDSADSEGSPGYTVKENHAMEFVSTFWSPEIGSDNTILELGCNVGVNLQYLHTQGYGLLSGLEIDLEAIERLKRVFPEMGAKATIIGGSLEKVLSGLSNDSVDAVFTVAVAMHIHPQSRYLFAEMARVAKKHICMVELETASNRYIFPRNYERVFRRLGARQVRSASFGRSTTPTVPDTYDGYTLRLFAVDPDSREPKAVA